MKWQRDHSDFTYELLDDAGHLAATIEPVSRRDPETLQEKWGWAVWNKSGHQVALKPDFEAAREAAESFVRGTS